MAKPETWWEITGAVDAKHSFTTCIARVLPEFVTGTDGPLFEVLLYGGSSVIPASAITRARQLELVYADEWDELQQQVEQQTT